MSALFCFFSSESLIRINYNNDSNATFWIPAVKNNIKTGDDMLKPPRQEGGNEYGINCPTEQKLQCGVHTIYDSSRKKQKWETYYSYEAALRRKKQLDLIQ